MTYTITADSTHAQVAAAHAAGATIIDGDTGADVTGLYCPHCELWIGWTEPLEDGSIGVLEAVSIDHPVSWCQGQG